MLKASPLQASGQFRLAKPSTRRRDTAFYIFDKDWKYPYEVDTAHFKAKNNTLNVPVVATSANEMEWIANQMIGTLGTIWEMVTLYVDGARIGFGNNKTPAEVYQRILDHLDAHLKAMRTQLTYMPPDADDFRLMAEFATAIRSMAIDYDPDLDSNHKGKGLASFLPMRASFSRAEEEARPAAPKIAKSVAKMDSIERYLEMINGR